MMINCKNCKTDFEPKSPKAVYCSTKCRVAANRNKKQESIVTELTETGIVTPKEAPIVTNGLKEKTYTLEDVCTPQEITQYPNMCETRREKAESIYRLENNSLEDLKKKDIWLPNWRRTSGKS
jgi:hypothetical protein